MNLTKTKAMGAEETQILVDGEIIEYVEEYVYMELKMKLGQENQTADS